MPFQYDPSSLASAGQMAHLIKTSPGVLLYVGPDQIMPVTSVLGALAGVALMFWGKVVGVYIKCRDAMLRRGRPEETGKP